MRGNGTFVCLETKALSGTNWRLGIDYRHKGALYTFMTIWYLSTLTVSCEMAQYRYLESFPFRQASYRHRSGLPGGWRTTHPGKQGQSFPGRERSPWMQHFQQRFRTLGGLTERPGVCRICAWLGSNRRQSQRRSRSDSQLAQGLKDIWLQ